MGEDAELAKVDGLEPVGRQSHGVLRLVAAIGPPARSPWRPYRYAEEPVWLLALVGH